MSQVGECCLSFRLLANTTSSMKHERPDSCHSDIIPYSPPTALALLLHPGSHPKPEPPYLGLQSARACLQGTGGNLPGNYLPGSLWSLLGRTQPMGRELRPPEVNDDGSEDTRHLGIRIHENNSSCIRADLMCEDQPERWEQTSEAWVLGLAAPGGTRRKPAPNACVPDRCILYHVMNSLTAGPASASAVATPENRAQRPRSCVPKMQITVRQIRIYSD